MLFLLLFLQIPVSATDFTAPPVPKQAEDVMPETQDIFPEALTDLLHNVITKMLPELKSAVQVCLQITAMILITTLFSGFGGTIKKTGDIAGTLSISTFLLHNTSAMILLARNTIQDLSSYGKLFLPVMTAALAAEGGITASTGLYVGTAFLDTVLGSLLNSVFVPYICVYLAFAVVSAAWEDDRIKLINQSIKGLVGWCLKTLLTVFTTYMSITGVVSGSVDTATLKATKVTISTFVPMVGGILSEASESVLVRVNIMKNSAGIYGILAILALFLEPFLRIGGQYLLLKASGTICSMFGTKQLTALIADFSATMGMLLAMTGSMCLFLLISTVCFMKGAGA